MHSLDPQSFKASFSAELDVKKQKYLHRMFEGEIQLLFKNVCDLGGAARACEVVIACVDRVFRLCGFRF